MLIGSKRAILNTPFNPYPLTLNQATGTDFLQNTTGFDKLKTEDAISSSEEEAYEGKRSLKVITPGSVSYEGATTSGISVRPGVTYNCTSYVKAPLGATYRFLLVGNAGSTGLQYFTGTGDWQRLNASITTTTDISVQSQIYTWGTVQATAFYWDKLRFK